MPHEPVVFHSDVVATPGEHKLSVERLYEAPSTADGEIANDPFARMDMANAQWMMNVLLQEYPGYPWRCIYDGAQKMAYLSIPILMGLNKFWAINLFTDEMTDGLLKRAGGQLLERYRLPRNRFDIDRFLEAREQHSALVLSSRKVPE